MESDIIAKRWIDTVKECSRKRDLDVRQARRMVRIGVNGGGLCGGMHGA